VNEGETTEKEKGGAAIELSGGGVHVRIRASRKGLFILLSLVYLLIGVPSSTAGLVGDRVVRVMQLLSQSEAPGASMSGSHIAHHGSTCRCLNKPRK
jgi:hypothetical protein